MLERGHRCGGEWLPRSGRGRQASKVPCKKQDEGD